MVPTTRLGGTASHIEVANVGHGLMLMTWTPNPVPDEQAFQAIKDGVDAAGGAKVLLNSGEFYGHQLTTTNLELLSRFYEKYPEYVDKTVLCIKGGLEPGGFTPIASEENMRRSLTTIAKALRGTKRIDIYENARVDPTRRIEDTMRIMKRLVSEGLFDHVGMSECSAETLRRAHAVHPVAEVEIEVSPWSYESETQSVITTAAELGITVLAYSPLGRGFLTGDITKLEDLPPGDMRRHLDRFQPENFSHNLQLVERLKVLAHVRGVTPAQLSLAWVRSLGAHMVPIPGSSKATRTLENLAAGTIDLTPDEKAEIEEVLEAFSVKGARYTTGMPNLWA